MVSKIIGGKKYKYFSSNSSKSYALRRANTIRKRDGFKARVIKDQRKYASTYHIYIRKKR